MTVPLLTVLDSSNLDDLMDPVKYKKLEDYVALLIKQGEKEEGDKEYSFAIGRYLKAVDVLIVMSESTPNYPTWVQCTTKAESYQKKIKSLIALAALQEQKDKAEHAAVSTQTASPTTSIPANPS